MEASEMWLYTVIVLILIGMGLLITCGIRQDQAFERECERRGGHVRELYKSNDLCVSAEGRILEW